MTMLNNDFLALTLANQDALVPFQFTFPQGDAFVEDTGILRLEPNVPSTVNLVVSVGIHGNETGPIELVNQLVASILDGRVSLNVRLLILIGNPVAANVGKRFCEVNLNRLFNGAWQQYDGFESKRAARLEKAIEDFFAPVANDAQQMKLHYDLHTAIRGSVHEKFVVYPFVKDGIYNQEQLGFLAASGIDAVLLSHQPTTTFSYYSHAVHGAHAFTVELGKVFPFGENDLTRFADLKQSLIVLFEQGVLAQSEWSSMNVFRVLDSLIKDDDSYVLNIADDVRNFTEFEAGYRLAHSNKSDYHIEQSGDAIVFPNTNLPIGQRAGLMVRLIDPSALKLG